jgi:hypothetical protein
MKLQTWKIAPITKGMLTYVPVLNAWRQHHATSGGTNVARYCYSVWLRHLIMLSRHGFEITRAQVGEVGPGDSIGIGLAALLAGASHYVGLDIVPFSARADLQTIFEELVQLYVGKQPIPDQNEFPRLRPALDSYQFPGHLVGWRSFSERVKSVRMELRTGVGIGPTIAYKAPWTSSKEIAAASLDLVFSQAVLEHVDGLEALYEAMSIWLKRGGYASHVIDFSSHGVAPFWNGHWAFSDWEWRSVRGRREYLLNRQPVSVHLACASRAGFEILHLHKDYGVSGVDRCALSKQFQSLDGEDLRTRGVLLILRKR